MTNMTLDMLASLTGNLIDRWEQLPQDTKDAIAEDCEAFYDAMEALWEAVEPAGGE